MTKTSIRTLVFIVIEIVIILFMSLTDSKMPWAGILLSLILVRILVLFFEHKSLRNKEQEFFRALDSDDISRITDLLNEIIIANGFTSDLKGAIQEYVNWRIKKNNADVFNKQTELTALQSQINPHFLYNTLDSIRGEAMINGDNNVTNMIETLASFFRYSISRKGVLVPLRDEIDNINNYMIIQKYRFNNRFALEVQIDDEDIQAMDLFVPRLILQPIVENSIFHGFENITEGGLITIDISLTELDLVITVSDNGRGMSLKELDSLNKKIHPESNGLDIVSKRTSTGAGIALANSNKRIQLWFGEKYGINVYSTEGYGTDVEIIIPVTKNGDRLIDEYNSTQSK